MEKLTLLKSNSLEVHVNFYYLNDDDDDIIIIIITCMRNESTKFNRELSEI